MDREPAVTLLSGRAHVLEAVNDTYRQFVADPPLFVPVREAFPDAAYRVMQATLDAVFTSGEPAILDWAGGHLVIIPRWRDGAIVGVGTAYWAGPVSLQGLRPLRSPERLEMLAS